MHTGLSTEEVIKKQKKFGLNEIPKPKHRLLQLFIRQFKSIFIVLLFLASLVTFLLGETFDAAFMLLFIILSVGLSFFQEYKSNAIVNKLQAYLARSITVRRNGEDAEIPVLQLVPGDILKLEPGDIVPADCVIRSTSGFQVDETTFTGESIPVSKESSTGDVSDNSSLLQGTIIVRGLAYAEVLFTGPRTRLAEILKTTTAEETKSESVKNIDKISTFILRTTLVTLLFIIIANVIIEGKGADIPHLLIFSIALAVSVIPEVLPLVMAFSLSNGASKLAKKGVVVKRLSSINDLGSIEILCTDKTGTITENKLVFQNCCCTDGSYLHPLVLSALTVKGLHKNNPEPFDRATYEALSPEQKLQVSEYSLVEEEPFDPVLRSNGVKVEDSFGNRLHIRRGAADYFFEQGIINHSTFEKWLEAEEELGRRVLGLSFDDGSGMKFGGFISFTDTLKPTTLETLKQAKELNVAVTIITGDSLRVAGAIGREVGLVTTPREIIDANVFFALPAIEQLERVHTIRVFARTTPEQKVFLIKLLKKNFSVGFLGEGINDAAALKAANVAMVVESASDVSRETADIILLKSDLGVITEGIKIGRETHVNILKYIRTTLISNFGNFYAVAVSSLFVTFLPMLPKQLLLLNLLTDIPMMAIAFDRVSKKEISHPQKYDFKSLYIIFISLGLISTAFDFIWFALFFKSGPQVLQTNWFIASVLTEIVVLFSVRSMLPMWKAGWPDKIIMKFSVLMFATTILLPYIPIAAHYFEFVKPTFSDLGLILALAFVYLIATEFTKRRVGSFLNQKNSLLKT